MALSPGQIIGLDKVTAYRARYNNAEKQADKGHLGGAPVAYLNVLYFKQQPPALHRQHRAQQHQKQGGNEKSGAVKNLSQLDDIKLAGLV